MHYSAWTNQYRTATIVAYSVHQICTVGDGQNLLVAGMPVVQILEKLKPDSLHEFAASRC